MLVNINDDILELLKLDDLEATKDNKQIIENTVNAYILGGLLTASKYGAIDAKEEDILNMMDYYKQKMTLHVMRVMLSKDFKAGFMIWKNIKNSRSGKRLLIKIFNFKITQIGGKSKWQKIILILIITR